MNVDWSNERYVRVYTRDTAEWVALGWDAQNLLMQLMRKADRAGLVEMTKSGLRGLSGLLRAPHDVVERALPILLDDGCVVRVEGGLLIRNFVEAQEATKSNALKCRDHRERRRDAIRRGLAPDQRRQVVYFVQAEDGGPIKIGQTEDLAARLAHMQTSRPEKLVVLAAVPGDADVERSLHAKFSHLRDRGEWFSPGPDLMAFIKESAEIGSGGSPTPNDTEGFTTPNVSRHQTNEDTKSVVTPNDTPSLAVPSLAVPSQSQSSSASPPTQVVPEGGERSDPKRAEVARVFETWRALHSTQRSTLDPKRAARIRARLAEGWTVAELESALRGALQDDWLMGRDPKALGRAYRGLETLLRDSAQVERLLALHGAPRAPGGPVPVGGRSGQRVDPSTGYVHLTDRQGRPVQGYDPKAPWLKGILSPADDPAPAGDETPEARRAAG